MLDERLDADKAPRSRVAVVGHDHDVGLVPTTVLVQVLDDLAERLVGYGERSLSEIGVHPGGVLGMVGFVAPVDREIAVVQGILRQNARGVLVASVIGISPLRPLAETLDNGCPEVLRDREFRVDAAAMPGLRFGVVDERVAAGACANGHEPLAVPGNDLRQCRTEEQPSGLLDDRHQLLHKRRERAGAVVLADDERVANETVPTGVAPRHDAGGVHPRDGRIDGVMVVKEDCIGSKRREIWHQLVGRPVRAGDRRWRISVRCSTRCWQLGTLLEY